MQLTRKSRSLIRRVCREAFRSRIEPLLQRMKLKARIAVLQEQGAIAIIHGGIDCDGGRWDNRVVMAAATVAAVERWSNQYKARAEGPQWQTLEKPTLAKDLTEDSRDLGLEAFEDGHSHVLFA